MPYYIINKNQDANECNEVHTTTCDYLPLVQNQISLGWHSDEHDAVKYAKNCGWYNADGCYYCCNKEHTR